MLDAERITLFGRSIMKDWVRKLYLSPDCLALSDAQLRVVDRRCIIPLLTKPIMVVHMTAILGIVACFYWLGLFRDDGRWGILSPVLSSVGIMLLSQGLVLIELRRRRAKISAYVACNKEIIEIEARHLGVPLDCISILEDPKYEQFIVEDPERRFIYWDDLPSRFNAWIKAKQLAESGPRD